MPRQKTIPNEWSTERITEHEAMAILEERGIQTQVLSDKIQALTIWTDKYAGGGIKSTWVDVVCRRNWLKAFLG